MPHPPNLSFRVGPLAVSAHFIFETIAYAIGFWLYRSDRRRMGDFLSARDRNSIIVGAVLGAAAGSKLLAVLEDPAALANGAFAILFAGKTIVGGILGATLSVEWTKRRLGIEQRTGDLFAIPLAVAIAIGRIGCFFSGLGDHTHGSPTTLPWGMDFGDGIARHPAQLYEIAFLLTLTVALTRLRPRLARNGELFRLFLVSYLLWRLAIDFLKPEPALGGLSAIQWACLLALAFYARGTIRMFSRRRQTQLHG